MKTRQRFAPVLICLAMAGSALGAHDFFDGARYPGSGKKPGVDLYKVKQTGGRYAEGYQRRGRPSILSLHGLTPCEKHACGLPARSRHLSVI